MDSYLNRVLTGAILGVMIVSFAAPSHAATHAKRHHVSAPAQVHGEYVDAAQAAHPDAPPIVLAQPNACFTDEGYGHYASCDQAGM